MSKLLEGLMKWFDDPENVKKFEKYLDEKNNFHEKYVKKLISLSKEDRDKLIHKIIEKYDSDEYIRKEYKLGYEPRKTLYDIIVYWAENYGERIENYTTDDYGFPCDNYIVDKNIMVTLIYGQGTKVFINFIELR